MADPTILATGDLHGFLPDIPECDILVIAGDICPVDESHAPTAQAKWLERKFAHWLDQIPAKHKILIAGNHDYVFEHPQLVDSLYLNCTYLQDEGCEIAGLTFYGIPWVPNLPSWAFHQDKAGLKLRYDAIPKGTDIVISHGPPFGYGDQVSPFNRQPGEHVGCKSATDMLARVQPRALICGHIHEGFGTYRFKHRDRTVDIYNVAYVDEYYLPREEIVPITIDVPDTTRVLREVHDPASST